MIKKTLFALALILAMGMFIYLTDKPEENEYVVKLNFNEWNTLVLSINSPDDVSKNQKAAVLTKIVSQINDQLKYQDSLLKQKAVKDSLKNKVKN